MANLASASKNPEDCRVHYNFMSKFCQYIKQQEKNFYLKKTTGNHKLDFFGVMHVHVQFHHCLICKFIKEIINFLFTATPYVYSI